MNDEFTEAGEVLKDLFHKIIPEDAAGYQRIFSGWEQIVGAETAMHVQLRDIINHSLLLEADHPGWTQRIRLNQARILSEIRKRYPELEISRIKIRVGEGRKQTSENPEKPGKQDLVEKQYYSEEKTPSVVSPENAPEEDRSFFETLEKMRNRGKP